MKHFHPENQEYIQLPQLHTYCYYMYLLILLELYFTAANVCLHYGNKYEAIVKLNQTIFNRNIFNFVGEKISAS